MRRAECALHDRADMDAILQRADDLHLAFNTGAAPYVLTVNHVLLDGALYFHCATQGRKLDCMRADARVGFTAAVDVRIEGTTTHYTSVCGHGVASLIEDAAHKGRVLAAIAHRFSAPCELPVPEALLVKTAVVRLEIVEMMGKKK